MAELTKLFPDPVGPINLKRPALVSFLRACWIKDVAYAIMISVRWTPFVALTICTFMTSVSIETGFNDDVGIEEMCTT
jgi:hypothetical protein